MDDDLSSELETAGAPADFFQSVEEREESKCYQVFPSNWTSLTFFLDCSTQWRYDSGYPRGFDYKAVWQLLKVHPEIEPDKRWSVFKDLQLMEDTVLEELAHERKHNTSS